MGVGEYRYGTHTSVEIAFVAILQDVVKRGQSVEAGAVSTRFIIIYEGDARIIHFAVPEDIRAMSSRYQLFSITLYLIEYVYQGAYCQCVYAALQLISNYHTVHSLGAVIGGHREEGKDLDESHRSKRFILDSGYMSDLMGEFELVVVSMFV